MLFFFSYFTFIFPWKRTWPFSWINLNPLHQTMLYAIFGWNWHVVLEKNPFQVCQMNIFLLFPYYLPLQKGMALHLKKILIHFTQGCFVSSLVEIGPVVWEKKNKMSKVYNNNNDKNNSDGQKTNFDQKSSLEQKIVACNCTIHVHVSACVSLITMMFNLQNTI